MTPWSGFGPVSVQEYLREAINSAGGVRALAREWGVSPSLISETECGSRRPGRVILDRLGWERITIYRRRHTAPEANA